MFTFLFATLSNYQKIDPQIFHVWMNIMNRFPSSKMVSERNRLSEHFVIAVLVVHRSSLSIKDTRVR